MRLIPLAILALIAASPASAQLSPAEQRIVSAVDEHLPANIAFHEAIVRINSGTHNHPGVRAVGDLVRPELEALGFTAEWIDQSAAGRAGHLFARREGIPGTTKLLLIGHLDTVFEPSSPFQTYSREGDIVTGPGVDDDKGGVAIMLLALQAMRDAGTLDGANITVALTGDEEDAGDPLTVSRADLVAAAEWADVALDFEGLATLDGQDAGSVARRSSNSWQVTAIGREGHSSGVFSAGSGYGAIYELARILDQFRRELPEDNLTYNVGIVTGGSLAALGDEGLTATASGKTNIIAPIAIARGDLRTISPEQTDRVLARMQAIVDANLPGTDAEISFELRYPPMPPTDANLALLARMNAINADLGLPDMPVFPPARRGAGDINFVAHLTDGLVGLGSSGTGAHAPGETVDLASFPRQAVRAAILMGRLAGAPYR